MSDVFGPDDDPDVSIVLRRPPAAPPGTDAEAVESVEPVESIEEQPDAVPEPSEPDVRAPAPQTPTQHREEPSAAAEARDVGSAAPDASSPIESPIEPAGPVKTVTIGAGDDLPDALTEIPPPLTGTGGATAASSSKGAVDPRMRRRRIDVGRAIGRRRLWWIVGTLVVLAAVLVPLGILTSSVFDVESIEVNGLRVTPESQIDPILADLRGEPILTVDLNSARERLERLPYVKSAALATDFPHRVMIEIDERIPLAAYAGDDSKWHVFDRDGRVLAAPAKFPGDIVAIQSVHAAVKPGGQAPSEVVAATAILTSIPDELGAWVDSVQVSPTGEVNLSLRSGTVIAFGQPGERPQTKVAVALQLLRKSGPRSLRSVDVTNPDAPKQVKR